MLRLALSLQSFVLERRARCAHSLQELLAAPPAATSLRLLGSRASATCHCRRSLASYAPASSSRFSSDPLHASDPRPHGSARRRLGWRGRRGGWRIPVACLRSSRPPRHSSISRAEGARRCLTLLLESTSRTALRGARCGTPTTSATTCLSSRPTASRRSTSSCRRASRDKGEVLTRLSAWWFERIAAVVPNHFIALITAENAALVPFDAAAGVLRPHDAGEEGEAPGRRMHRARLPLRAAAGKSYQRTGAVCGIALRRRPARIRAAARDRSSRPSTKAEVGPR